MAGHAAIHREFYKRTGRRFRQSLHRSMAGLAAYLGSGNVNAMREKNMRRHSPNPLPGNLLSFLAIRPKLLDFLARRLPSRVASHTQRRGRSAGYGIRLSPNMAARARQVHIDVSLVGKCDGLAYSGLNPTAPETQGQGRSNDDEN